MLSRKKKESISERKNPGDSEPENCSPGSIEQQLDMCEEGSLRGDEISRRTVNRASPDDPPSEDPLDLDQEINVFEVTMAERDREGDDLSGDEHSFGLQGDESELENQPNIDRGVPGDQPKQQNSLNNIIHIRRARKTAKKRSK
jgi:hypothetical protein